MNIVQIFRTGLLLAIAAVGAASAQTVDFPRHAITLIAPSTPGSTPDVLARLLAQRMSQAWNQSVVVVNRPGAGGDIGTDAVARAEPDGHTILLGSIANTVNPHLIAKRRKELDDLTPVSMLVIAPDILVVHPSSKLTNVQELIGYLKSNQGLAAAHAGTGTTPHLSLTMFGLQTGAPFVSVPYQGGGATLQGLLSQQVQFMFSTSVGVLPSVRSGQLRALAVTSTRRISAAPSVPTMEEAGVPGFDLAAWFGLFAPPKTPKSVVDRIADTARTVMIEPEFAQRLRELGAEPAYLAAPAFATHVAAEYAKWGRLAKAAKLSAE
jgi:tripartite-type tricarboxylate transporter receptor subunit TctC